MRRQPMLVAAAVLGGALAAGSALYAQLPRGPQIGRVLSGDDIGFRIDGTDPRNGGPTGTWMVRVNGEWVAISSVPKMQLAK